MMDKQLCPLTPLQPIRRVERIIDFEHFRLKDRLPRMTGWICRAAWWGLHRLGALERREVWEERFVYDPEANPKVGEALQNIALQIVKMNRDPADYAVIIGLPQWRELVGQDSVFDYAPDAITVEHGPFRFRTGYQRRRFNLLVHVCPTVDGLAAVPRVVLERIKDA